MEKHMFRHRAVILAVAAAATAPLPVVAASGGDRLLLVEEHEKFPGAGQVFSIETRAHRFFADAGESGPAFDVSAMISVLVTRDGRPVTDLGASVPMSGGAIALPPEWTLQSSFVAPPGPLGIGCVFDATQFQNAGNGLYTIRVVPSLGSPLCRWGLGDYHYRVSLSRGAVRGSALGVLTIPDSPSVP
jgi:hypothetical protein